LLRLFGLLGYALPGVKDIVSMNIGRTWFYLAVTIIAIIIINLFIIVIIIIILLLLYYYYYIIIIIIIIIILSIVKILIPFMLNS
jgi:hypothetical protein